MTEERASKRQKELFQFVETFIDGHGYGPSYREIMRSLGYKSVSTVATHIDGLIAKGYLRKIDNSARSLEVVRNDEKVSPLEQQLLYEIEKRFRMTTPPHDELKTLIDSLKVLQFSSYVTQQKRLAELTPSE